MKEIVSTLAKVLKDRRFICVVGDFIIVPLSFFVYSYHVSTFIFIDTYVSVNCRGYFGLIVSDRAFFVVFIYFYSFIQIKGYL